MLHTRLLHVLGATSDYQFYDRKSSINDQTMKLLNHFTKYKTQLRFILFLSTIRGKLYKYKSVILPSAISNANVQTLLM